MCIHDDYLFEGGTGFHNNAVVVNPQDLAPAFSGSVFGLMNTVGAIPGNFFKENIYALSSEHEYTGFIT